MHVIELKTTVVILLHHVVKILVKSAPVTDEPIGKTLVCENNESC